MQVQLEILDEFLEKPTIFNIYRDLVNIFLLSHANLLPLHPDEDHIIEMKPRKTLLFDLVYNLSEY